MSGKRAFRVAATSARVLTGAVVAAACVIGVVAGVAAPWPTLAHEPAQIEVTPLPGDTVLVCNGDFRAIGRDSAAPLEMESAASPRVTAGGAQGIPEANSLAADDLEDGDVRVYTATAEGRDAPLAAAAESVTLAEDDLAGYAAAPCREALTESWLVGGSVATGTEDIVILTNPGEVTSTVTLSVYGSVRASRSVIVPAASQVALPLTSMAVGSLAPVVKVTATGSPVRAVLQSSLTRTLDPIGIDLQDAVPGPQQTPVIAGVQVNESEGDGGATAVLRMMSPESDTTAEVNVRREGETAIAASFDVPLEAGMPVEVPLDELKVGAYDVQIEAPAAILAAVRQNDHTGPGSDFAWVMPAPEVTSDTLFAVPSGPAPRLVIVNQEDVAQTITLEPIDGGDAQTITVAAGGSTAVDLDDRTVYRLGTSGVVHAVVAIAAPGALAAWPVWPSAATGESITVYP